MLANSNTFEQLPRSRGIDSKQEQGIFKQRVKGKIIRWTNGVIRSTGNIIVNKNLSKPSFLMIVFHSVHVKQVLKK